MEAVYEIVPLRFFQFIVIAFFSLIIGLSQKTLHVVHPEKGPTSFGSDRTFTFIGIVGYILWIIDAGGILYLVGFVVLALLLAVDYYLKISLFRDFGLTTIVIALITFLLPAVIITQPFWFFLLVYVTVLVLTELKEPLNTFATKINKDEILTLGKFLAIAGIILPMVPDRPVVSFLEITPYKIWLAVVVISSISYLSYLLRRYVFRDTGIIITGILGGLYSSTMTTIVLARQSRQSEGRQGHFAAGILLATAMMYLRIAVIMAVFNREIFLLLLPWFAVLALVSGATGGAILFFSKEVKGETVPVSSGNVNPLEFRVALIFTLLFVAFSFITWFTLEKFGSGGLQALAYIVGVTDIDPFLINLFSGKFTIGAATVAVATLQATFSNNLAKMIYGVTLGSKSLTRLLLIGFGLLILVNLVFIFIV